MTISALSAPASVVASTTSSSSASKLVKLASGEYTAASVSADPTDAAKLALVREKDGNYGTAKAAAPAPAKVATTSPPAAQTSAVGLAALATLTLGGA